MTRSKHCSGQVVDATASLPGGCCPDNGTLAWRREMIRLAMANGVAVPHAVVRDQVTPSWGGQRRAVSIQDYTNGTPTATSNKTTNYTYRSSAATKERHSFGLVAVDADFSRCAGLGGGNQRPQFPAP